MSQEPTTWTSSQRKAFSYVQSAVERGMTATSGLKEYRIGGGSIRDAYWYGMFKETFAQVGTREKVAQIPSTYIIPDAMFQESDFDFRAKYVAQIEVRGYSEELGQSVRKWTTVESDILVTKREWLYGAQQAISNTLGSPPFEIKRVLDWQIFKRVRE